MYLKTQKFFILGISKSGFAVAKYALEKGAECYVYEELKNSTIDANIEELINLDVSKYQIPDFEFLIKDSIPSLVILIACLINSISSSSLTIRCLAIKG